MRNDVVIGLDISPTHMGWSVWENGKLVGCGYSALGGWLNATHVAEQITIATGLNAAVRIIVEETLPKGRNTGGMGTVSATGKAIGRVLQELETQLGLGDCRVSFAEYITCHDWRKRLWPYVGRQEGMDRKAWKAKAIAHCDANHQGWRQMFDAGAAARREDVAEAICIGESVALDRARKGMVESAQEGER